MLKFARGDAAAFETLYARHEMRLFRYLRRQVREDATANDLCQETWFAVARNAVSYQPSAKFTTWLFTIAHHRLVDQIRTHRPTEDLEEEGSEAPTGSAVVNRLIADAGSDPHHIVQSQNETAFVLKAVEQLPPEQRSAFLLQAEADLSLEEIATITGASFETVKSRLRYARNRLRQLLWEYA
jgi:RNA polymerase sigma-70 factor (ECF subfamily)